MPTKMTFKQLATYAIVALLLKDAMAESATATRIHTAVTATRSPSAFLESSKRSPDSAGLVNVQPAFEGQQPDLEYTALGDSYASGVGSTRYVDGRRCLRYDETYPIIINLNPEWPEGVGDVLPPGFHKLNYVACSGAEAQDILDWQLLDEPTSRKPDIQYGNRPAFGAPDFATLTAGGDDIDFPGILFNCILGAHIPGGPKYRSCTDQRAHTWSLLNDGSYIRDVTRVIEAIIKKGQAQDGPKGENFRLYVTGYARFFNADTTGDDTNCDGTTFNIDGLWRGRPIGPDGAQDAMLTTDLRKDFNNMADALNSGVHQAVNDYNNAHGSGDPRVTFVDIQTDKAGKDILKGHRFCEPGVQEPDTNNNRLYFFHYPYSKSASSGDDPMQTVFETAWNQTFEEASGDITETYPNFNRFLNAVFGNITPELFNSSGIADYNEPASWGGIGDRVRVFHPQFAWHNAIANAVLAEYLVDHREDGDEGEEPIPDPDGTLELPDILKCNVQHDDGDEKYYFDLDTGIQAIADFCQANHDAGIALGSTTSVQVGGIILQAERDEDADDSAGCPAIDMTADTFVDLCTKRLQGPLHNCDTAKRDSDLWKQGGSLYSDCVTWSLGLPSNLKVA